MDTLVLQAETRQLSQKPKALRGLGRVPAVYYGKGQENQVFTLGAQEFRKVFKKAGENTVIELSIDGKTTPVLVHEVQYDPVSDELVHVDLIHVDMKKEVTASVKIVTTGVCPAVKNLGGILDILKHEVEIKCLPKDLIHEIVVDVTPIVDFHTSIHVKDLKVPSGIKILGNPEDAVVTATPPRKEEEVAPAAAAAPVAGETAAGAAVPAAGAAAPAATAPAAGQKK